jgi:hypothetical protein
LNGKPNWCNPCGGYRSRDHECERQPVRPAAIQVPWSYAPPPARENIDEDQLARIPEASDHRFIAGWRAGWTAAMEAVLERGATPGTP